MATDVQATATAATTNPTAPKTKGGKGAKRSIEVNVPEGGFTANPVGVVIKPEEIRFRCLVGGKFYQTIGEEDFADPVLWYEYQEALGKLVVEQMSTKIEEIKRLGSTQVERVAWNEIGGDVDSLCQTLDRLDDQEAVNDDMLAEMMEKVNKQMLALQEKQAARMKAKAEQPAA